MNHSDKKLFLTDQFNRISEVTREALLTSKQKYQLDQEFRWH